ncbi:MAG: transcription termination factor NusA, partial [Selenomonadales bacterium]|nr:transcription termination factor NusA [Selenomonadales bacterium]
GAYHVFSNKEVVEEVFDPVKEMSLATAHRINPDYGIGDIVAEEVTPRNFGRLAAQAAKQIVVQKIREAERDSIYDDYQDKENDIVTGTVQRVDENGNIFVDLGKTEGMLAASEKMAADHYQINDFLKAYILEVRKGNKGTQISLSRTHPGLLKRLFELEVPEISEGVVEIKSVAREAGARSKIAVYATDDNIDAVGSCVGHRGLRVQNVVNELNNEKIDIVKWSEDPAVFIANALSPAQVVSVEVDEENKFSRVIVPDYQLSLAIGKEGQNARLAAKLTSWKIDIKSETQAKNEAENAPAVPAEDEQEIDIISEMGAVAEDNNSAEAE